MDGRIVSAKIARGLADQIDELAKAQGISRNQIIGDLLAAGISVGRKAVFKIKIGGSVFTLNEVLNSRTELAFE